jgi:hypothetical protein
LQLADAKDNKDKTMESSIGNWNLKTSSVRAAAELWKNY